MKPILSSLIFFSLIPSIAVAQITPDSSLGAEKSVVESSGNRDTIQGGAIRNTNLFHSFQEFNVGAGREAYFANPNGIANIFSRVTGNNFSNIQGVLGVLGNANLYLINPNGILFGANARLDVNGSFFATTADSVVFSNGFEFSAVNPDAPPLLTIDIPIGLRFRDNPGDIVNRSVANEVGLQVDTGQTLVLIGGEITFEGGRIIAPGSNIELGGLLATGTVTIEDDFKLSFPEAINKADVFLLNGAEVNVASDGGGAITINAKDITLIGGSQLVGGIAESLGNTNSQAGDITLNATNAIAIDNSFVFNRILGNARGNGGNLFIDTKNLSITGNAGDLDIRATSMSLTNGALIDTRTFGQGDAGDVEINATDSVSLDDSSILTWVTRDAKGNAGNITLAANIISLTNGASLDAGMAGEGNAGNVKITTGSISLSNDTKIITSTFGQGNAGDLTINASEKVLVSGENTRIEANVGSTAVGTVKGGDLTINTKQLLVTDGAQVSTSTFGQGNAGDLTINASEFIKLRGEDSNGQPKQRFPGGLFAQVDVTGEGQGGNLTIDTPFLSISDGSKVQVATFGQGNAVGQGNAGKLLIRATKIDIFNTSVFSDFTTGIFGSVAVDAFRTEGLPEGNGGNITIVTEQLRVIDGGKISVITEGFGNAGILDITATESIEIRGVDPEPEDGVSFIGANVTERATGKGGDVNIKTESLIVSDYGEISVSSEGNGIAGDIEITAKSITLDDNASISAETLSADGGNIDLQIQDLLTLNNQSKISTTAGTAQAGGDGGKIDIDSEFIVAFPNQNNDITANAFEGKGGNINITSEGIFGLEERSSTPPNETNDIDASSDFGLDGSISIDTPTVDPTSGLVELTQEVVDAAKLIAQNVCTQTANSEFVDIGKGGLPQNPDDILAEDMSDVGLVAPVTASEAEIESNRETEVVKPKITTRKPPAQGWIWHEDGSVELVAYNPNQAGEQRTWDNQRGCQ